MSLPLPSFLRRRLLLLEARRALLAGEPELALERLGDPCLALSEGAERLRARALEVLCREAARLSGEGRERSAARLLERVEGVSPPLARAWRQRARLLSDPADVDTGGPSPAAEQRIAGAVGGLLARMRAERGVAGAEVRTGAGPAQDDAPAPVASAALRFHLAVDEAGELLFALGPRLVLGHASAGRADLPLLGDVDAEHLALVRGESFHGGPTWRVEPLSPRPIEVDGHALPPGGSELRGGELVRIAPHVAFRFRRPEPASGSALLELLHGLECEGATRVVLLAEGPAGRIRLGGRRGRPVAVPGLLEDVELLFEGGELVLRSEARLDVRGWDPAPGAGEVRLPCPPPARIDVRVGVQEAGRPPLGFSVRAVGPPSSAEGRP